MARRRGAWSRGEEVLYRVLTAGARFMGGMPFPLTARLGRGLGRMLWPLAGKRRRIARANLDLVYGDRLSPRRKERIAFRSFAGLLQDAFVLVTTANTPPRRLPPLLRIVNRAILDETAAAKRGAILISGHLSNFYFALGYLGRLGYDVAALVRPFAIRPAQRVLVELAAASGVRILDQGKSMMRLIRHLTRGGITWFTLDQNARRGVLVDFLGHPATTFAGPVRLARRLDLPIIPAFVRQTGPCLYELRLDPPIRLPATAPSDDELFADLTRLMRILEAEVRRNPEQWLWGHRRWRHGARLAYNA
jgi:KDO2-lipid IV(A) lauroyltransferase